MEEERSDSMSVYSSVSQGSRGSRDFDSISMHSGSLTSAPLSNNLQSQLRSQLEKAHTIGAGRSLTRPPVSYDTYDPPRPTRSVSISGQYTLFPSVVISISSAYSMYVLST